MCGFGEDGGDGVRERVGFDVETFEAVDGLTRR